MAPDPLDLSVAVTDASGVVTRWGPEDINPENVPRGLQFRTQRMQGFADANITLRRRIDRDYVDLHLLDDIAFIGADGSTAYEGRVGALPRSLGSDGETVTLQAAGWMGHAAQRTFTMPFVDRDLSVWTGPTPSGTAARLAGGFEEQAFSVEADDTGGFPAIRTRFTDAWVAGHLPVSDAYYDAGSDNVAATVYYDTIPAGGVSPADTNWSWILSAQNTDNLSGLGVNSGELRAANSKGYFTPSTAYRYMLMVFAYGAAGGTAGVNYDVLWRNIAVYGGHGLPRYGPDPGGILGSDAIKYIAGRFAPKLDTTGVQATQAPIPHLVFRDAITPYDAWLQINAYYLWDLFCWENRRLVYAPRDLTDYDWEIRRQDGVDIQLQGDNAIDLRNGVVVQFQNVETGRTELVTPDDNALLADQSPDNPVNVQNDRQWGDPYVLSFPTTLAGAVNIGRAALLEAMQPKSPGTITASHYVRDRAGHMQPAWKVRAGDRVIIADHPNDAPRPIAETTYNDDDRTVQMAVDSTFQRLDAVIDRINVDLAAANLSS